MDSKSNLDSPQTRFLIPIWLPVNSLEISSKRRERVEQGTKAYSHRVPTAWKSRQDRKVRPEDLFIEAAGLERAIGSLKITLIWKLKNNRHAHSARKTVFL